MKEEEAAALDFDQAEKIYKLKRYRNALINFEAFTKSYPHNNLSADALFRIAKIHEIQKDLKKMTSSLEQLIEKYPLSHIINDAKFELGKLYIKSGMNPEAKNALASINLKPYDPQKQIQILTYLRDTLKILQNWEELLYCDIKIYDTSTEFTSISQLKSEIFDLIEAKLSDNELIRLTKSREGSYPADIALWKLAKLAYHIGDFRNTRDYLTDFLKRYPLNEYYKEAQNLYERLERRKSPDPQAIGLLIPLSGPHSAIGEIALKGAWLATEFFNRQKSPYDEFKIVIKDTEGNPDVAARAFDELVFESRVIGVVGPMLTRPSEVVALKAQEYGVPSILLNQSENITEVGDFVFRNFITKSEQARTLAKFAVLNLGIKRFAFLYPKHSYGIDFVNAFWDELTSHPETEVTGAEAYEPDENDFSEPIKKLTGLYNLKYRASEICDKSGKKKRASEFKQNLATDEKCYEADKLPPIVDFEGLIIPDNYEKIIQIAPALLYNDVKAVQLIGGNLWNSDNLFKENSGRYLQGAIFTDSFFKFSKKPKAQQFTKTYRETFSEEPEIIANHSYEAVSVMLQTIINAKPSDSQTLRNALQSQTNLHTISGDTSFSPNRNLDHNLSILVIDGNEIKELY